MILQDTTEFSYKRDAPEKIGFTGKTNSRKDKAGRLQKHTVCGMLMHSSVAHLLDEEDQSGLSRSPPTRAPKKTAITTPERLMPGTPAPSHHMMSYYLTRIAKLGGYLARKGDPPPGHMTVWRGMTRLADIVLGLSTAKNIVGN